MRKRSKSNANFQDALISLQNLAEKDERQHLLLDKLIGTNRIILASIDLENPPNILDVAVKEVCRLANADCAVLFPFDLDVEDYDPELLTHYGLLHPNKAPTNPRIDGTASKVRHEDGLIVENISTDNLELNLLQDEFIIREQIQAFIGIPLTVGHAYHGILYIDFREARQFEDFEIETYQLFADNLTQTISLAKSLELNHRRANHLASLNKIGVALTSETILHREQIYEIIHEQVDKLLDADNYYMALYDQEQDVVSFAQVVVDGTSVPVGVSPYTPRKRGKGLTELIIETKEPMLARHGVGELYEKAGRKDYVGKLAKSWVGVPLLFQDNVMGVIALYDWKKEMVYDDQDKEFLQTIGTQAATALQIRKNFLNLEAEFKRTESANKRLKTAREISQAVVTDLGVDHILQVLRDHFKCDYAIILNLDPETDELYIFSQSGVGDVLDKTPRIPLGQGVSGQAAQQNRTIRLNDVQKHQKGTYVKYIADVKSEMATPLRDVSGKVIGVLDLEHVERDAFDLEDELLIELVAEEIVLALRNIEHIEELKLREEKERFSYLGILAAGIAHKIGGSVGLIGFEINDIRRLSNNASPELEEVLQRFEVEKKYLHELSEALLKPEQAKKATIEPIEIHKVLDDAIEVAQNRLDELDVPPTLTGIESLPPVNGNKFLVEVFAELIRNSVKAMKESPQKILQINGRTTTANNFVEIHFIDTGHGISVEQIDHIFELFFTLSSVGGEGGYGLWMIKSIVTGFGGNIYAESEGEDKGSRFIICLPIT